MLTIRGIETRLRKLEARGGRPKVRSSWSGRVASNKQMRSLLTLGRRERFRPVTLSCKPRGHGPTACLRADGLRARSERSGEPSSRPSCF